ncbi:DNA excision repair protein ERCC-4 [Ceratobasidium sp. AG-Ba]|nr:DNA excision repair protein ERCC-4 [Ceratobasidium sp. AG-Ba]
MANTDPTKIVDISDSESDNDGTNRDSGLVLASSTSQNTIFRSDSVLVIESSDSEGPDWSNSDEFSTILGHLNINSLQNNASANPAEAGSAPLLALTIANDTIVLSSSEDESSAVPLSIQQAKPKAHIPRTPKACNSERHSSNPKKHNASTQLKDLKGADARLYREVNKLVTDRKSTIKDFTVEISFSLQGSEFIEPFVEKLTVYGGSTNFFEPPDGVQYLIRFRRRHIAQYDSNLKEWIPVEAYTRLEDLYIIFLTPNELAQAVSEESLPAIINALRKAYQLNSRSQIFLMIDGMNAYYKRKGNKKVKRDIVESSITLLQAVERCFVVHVDGPEDTAQWLFNVTSDLGIKPHKRIRDSFLPFCTDTKVKCGTSKTDTYKKMLQQIHGITESAADGVIQEVPTLRMLFEGYEEENDVLVEWRDSDQKLMRY